MTLKSVVRVIFGVVAQMLVVTTVWVGAAGALTPSYQVEDIRVDEKSTAYTVVVQGDSAPRYTVYELFDPLRVVVDIADASFAESLEIPRDFKTGPISQITGKILSEKERSIAKLEILLRHDWSYSAATEANNIRILFKQPEKTVKVEPAVKDTKSVQVIAAKTNKKVVNKEMPKPEAVAESAASQEKAMVNDPVADLLKSIATSSDQNEVTKPESMVLTDDKFAAAGYKKKKISVDFYKIDLHNVFRMFGEISGANMIIDQGVSGTLTLALKDVPWDFALDIILNLKGLQKEERFNTIVISPSDKTFSWPEEPEKALEIKRPSQAIKVAIEQRLEMPEGVLEAKKLMRRANELEKAGEFSDALKLYEEAFLKWPDNIKLAQRISSFCMVNLGMNAKALHYAKEALKIDAENPDGALLAAVAAANMQKPEADDYFKKALSTLDRCAAIYGDSLDSMIARARILDRDGQADNASTEYRAILLSGFPLDNDLRRYIEKRVSAK